jgi:GT2 family glycosyltransferase/MoaA/NifB/PqqE/SkfB family radical SAM enzyme/cytochrome c-type biogenesis protein CcmH/NrfG
MGAQKYLYNIKKLENNLQNNNIYIDNFPTQVHFLMIDKCNAKCIMCGGNYFCGNSKKKITLDKFKKMASNLQLQLCRGIVLAGAGDPLLNMDLVPIIRFVREKYPHISISITTNGIALTDKLSESFLDNDIAIVNISINSSTRETYRRIMQVDCFDKVCKNVKNLVDMRNRRANRTKIQFSNAINKLNIEELPLLVELSSDLGVDSINIMYCRFYPEKIRHWNVAHEENRLHDKDSLFYHQQLSDKVVEKTEVLAKKYRINFLHEPLFKENVSPQPCIWPIMELMVGFDGEIYPCGGSEVHFKEKVEKGIYNFGNALTESIDSFWNNDFYQALRISSKKLGTCLVPECKCCANVLGTNEIRAHIMEWDKTIFGEKKQSDIVQKEIEIEFSENTFPQISVIVPTYNRPDMLTEALKSILEQTFRNYEIVVVNDAGMSVEDVILKMNKEKNIVYISHAKNRGLAAARNTGIMVARGKYIALLDDDDLFYPNHLETAITHLNEKMPIIYTDATRATYEKHNDSYRLVGKKIPYSIDFERNKLLVGNISPVNCFVFEKKKALQTELFDETLTTLEDWDFWIRLSERCTFKHIAKVTAQVNWRTDGTTMTSSLGADFQKNRDEIYKRYEKQINQISDIKPILDEFNQIWKEDNNPILPLVSIIVLTYNQMSYTRKCLESIIKNTQVPFELIVVDNSSSDGTVEYLESELTQLISEDRLRVIKNNENLGFAKGNNQGIMASKADYIMLLNNDVVVTQGWLSRMIACAEKDPMIGIVGPKSNYVSGPQLVENVSYDTKDLNGLERYADEFAENNLGKTTPFLRVVGFCMLIKRAVINKIGGLDTRYGLGNFEDDDFSLRAKLAGYESRIAEDCFIHHFGNRTFMAAQIDYKKSLHNNWEIFKWKWRIPQNMPYGSSYDLSFLLKDGFIHSKHYNPIEEMAGLKTSNAKETPLNSIQENYYAIQHLISLGQKQEAKEALEKLLLDAPDFVLAHNDLGVLSFQDGDKAKALEHYERAVALQPFNVTFMKNLADFYYVESGRIEDAMKLYVKVLNINPKDKEILLIIGHICVYLQKFDDAKVFYNRVLEIEPQNKDARQNLDKISSSKLSGINNQNAGSNIISDPNRFESKSPEEIYQSIQPLIKEEKFEKAIEKLEELLESHPDFSLADNDLGVLYYKQGNKEKALDHYEKAAELEPENMTFQKNLADFYCAELGRLEDALRIYNKILESDPMDVEVLFAIGYICESLQQFEDAKIFYSKILEVEPWNEDARKNLDRFLAKGMTGEIPENIEQKSCNVVAGSDGKSEEEAEPASEVNQNIKPLIAENGSEDTALAATIIINCSSKKKELNNCLQSIKNNTFLNYNIVFINTGAAKGALKLMKRLVSEHKDKKYSLIKKKKNSSLADAYNDGLKIAAGKYLVLMHDDVVVPENWLSDMIECMGIDSETGLAGPVSNNADGIQKSLDPGYQSFDEFFDYSKKIREGNRHRRVPTRKLSGFCVMLKQEVVEKTGLFDEKFNTETVMMQDYCLRAIISGYQNVIAGDVYVHHNDDCRLIDSAFDNKDILNAEQKIFFEKWSGLDAKGVMGKGLIAFKALEMADEFNHKGDVEKAVDALLHGIGNSHGDRSLYVAAAKILAAAKQFQDALDTIDEIPQIKGVVNTQTSVMEEARILELRGFCMAGLGRDDEAQEYAEKALLLDQVLDRDFAPALNLKGMLAYKKGNSLEAEKFFERAIAADPSYGEPYTHLGTMKWEAGDEEEALEFYERGFILAPAAFDVATLYHAAMIAKEKFSRCEKFSRDAAALFPNNKKIEYMLIDLLIKQDKYDEAMENVEAAIVKFGIDDGILAAAGRIRDILGPIKIDKSIKKEKTVSLCMIVKNEENDLAKCLKSIKPIVDEMIVVDTGSADRTKELARIFGAKTFDYKWTDDFSDARNYSISRASGAWIFTLDADEVMSSRDYEAFRNLIDGNTDNLAAYLVTTRNYSNKSNTIGWMVNTGEYPDEETGGGWMPTTKARLFHNNSRIRFDYPVHEMLDPSLLREKASVRECNIPVHHYGKLDEENCAEKGEKYYRIGILKLEEMGDSEIALRELAVQAGILEKNEDSIDLWKRFLALDLDPDNKFIGDAYVNMASANGKIGRYEDASRSAKKAMELFPNMKEAPYAYAYAELFRGNAEEAISIIENLLIQVSEYPPARFLLVMAHICSGMKKKGMDGLARLKKTLNISAVAVACHEFAKGLISAQKIEYALLLLEAAMESNITSKDILSLFSECLEKRERTFASEKAA